MAKTDFPGESGVCENSYDWVIIYPMGKKELKELLPNERSG